MSVEARREPEPERGGSLRLLCVDNGAIAMRGSARLLNRHSADFFIELAERFPGTVLAQALVDFGEMDTLGDKDLSSAGLAIDGLPWRTGSTLGHTLNYVRALPWVLSRTRRADFLYIFMPGRLPLLFALAARLLRRPYGVYLRGEIRPRDCRLVLAAARFVLAVNDGMRDVAARYCADADPIRPMIEYGLGDLVLDRKARRSPPWRLLFVGRIEELKGVGDLIDAAALLAQRGVPFELDLVGGAASPSEFQQLVARARRAGLPESIFRGVAKDSATLAEFYRRADVLVLPTHSEGFARVLYEAMIFGLPILTTFVGGIPSVLSDGVDALRLPVRDPAGMADAIERALADPALRERIGAAGSQLIARILRSRPHSHAELFERKLRKLSAPAPA